MGAMKEGKLFLLGKQVSLTGETRLTYAEACAILLAIDVDHIEVLSGSHEVAHENAVLKLKKAIKKEGGITSKGKLLHPF